MQDHELYRRILGIEAPWEVERVELKLQQGEVHVHLVHQNKPEWACAECSAFGPLYDHQPEGNGGIWTPVSIEPFCMPRRHVRSAQSTGCGW